MSRHCNLYKLDFFAWCFNFGIFESKPKIQAAKLLLLFSFPFSVFGMAPVATAVPLVAARSLSSLRVWATLRMLRSMNT